jgi:hypothetical protein
VRSDFALAADTVRLCAARGGALEDESRRLAPCPRSGGLILRYRAAISIAVSAFSVATVAATASAARARSAAFPHWWLREALCVHRHESVDWHRTTDWLGRQSPDRGGMQIDVGTWHSRAPRRYPSEPSAATPHEQLVVAYRIWLANGHRFGGNQWYLSAASCGVR